MVFAKAPTKVELKYDDGGAAIFNVLSAGTTILLSTIPNGTGPSERIGRAVQYSDITLNYKIQVRNPTETGGCRVFIVYDRQTNGAAPAITDILTQANTMALYNANNRTRFKILYDKTHSFYYIPSNATNGTGGRQTAPTIVTNHNIKLTGLAAHFKGSGSGIGDIDSGALTMIVVTDVNDTFDFTETNRIQYTDI